MKKHYSFLVAALLLNVACLFPTISSAQKIAGGGRHTLAVCIDSTVKAWGWNNYGELGNGGSADSNVPVDVSGLTGITAIGCSYANSYAVKSDGTAWAWGNNTSGELGNGITGGISNIPVQVSSLSGIVAMAGGQNHSVALSNNGTVWTWGSNVNGQLGNGNNTQSNVPVQVTGLTGIVQIAVGNGFCVALKNNGTVWTWGWNNYGQLGNGTTTDSNVPLQVTTLSGITAIAANASQSPLALKNDSTVWAWGYNANGQLGDSTTTHRYLPVQVHGPGNTPFLTGITALATGDNWSIALKSDGSVWEWGNDSYGQLGDNEVAGSTLIPIQPHGIGDVGLLTGIIAIAAGYGHTIAIHNDSTVLDWGWNSYGQLGDGSVATAHWYPESVISMCQVVTLVNEMAERLSFSIFPNPSNGNFQLTLDNIQSATCDVEIFNLLGAQVYQQKIFTPSTLINLKSTVGIYFVKITHGEKMFIQKLVIQ